MIRKGITDPRSLGSRCIKGTTLGKDFSVSLMHHDPSDLGSVVLFRIIPKECTLSNLKCHLYSHVFLVSVSSSYGNGPKQGPGLNFHHCPSFPLSFCGPISVTRTNCHMNYMGIKIALNSAGLKHRSVYMSLCYKQINNNKCVS